jgi:predicted DNA-binding protein with PD1-like motif
MEFASLDIKKIHILRVDPGEKILASIERFLKEADIQQAVVLGGYGTMAVYHLHWVIHNRLPIENIKNRGEGGFELLSMSGLVVDGEPHIHVTLAAPGGAFGGHLEPECTAYALCEVFFAEVEGVEMSHRRVEVAVEGMGEGKVTRLLFGKT